LTRTLIAQLLLLSALVLAGLHVVVGVVLALIHELVELLGLGDVQPAEQKLVGRVNGNDLVAAQLQLHTNADEARVLVVLVGQLRVHQ